MPLPPPPIPIHPALHVLRLLGWLVVLEFFGGVLLSPGEASEGYLIWLLAAGLVAAIAGLALGWLVDRIPGARGRPGALVLLGVLLSAEAQRAWSDASLEYPAVEGVSAATGLPPASQVVWSETSLTELASLRAGALRYIEELENPRPEVPNPSPPEPDEASPDADKATD